MSDKKELVTFLNVRISVEAADPKEAYKKLCQGIRDMGAVDWQTDLYLAEKDGCYFSEERSTEELFGE